MIYVAITLTAISIETQVAYIKRHPCATSDISETPDKIPKSYISSPLLCATCQVRIGAVHCILSDTNRPSSHGAH